MAAKRGAGHEYYRVLLQATLQFSAAAAQMIDEIAGSVQFPKAHNTMNIDKSSSDFAGSDFCRKV